ncbi:MAG: hypothetical protein WCA32_16065 [Chromatiaceae bacterium]
MESSQTRTLGDIEVTEETNGLGEIPNWYLETFKLVQLMDGGLRSVETELVDALQMTSMHPSVRVELQGLLDALRSVKGNLVLVDMTAREVLDEMLSEAA